MSPRTKSFTELSSMIRTAQGKAQSACKGQASLIPQPRLGRQSTLAQAHPIPSNINVHQCDFYHQLDVITVPSFSHLPFLSWVESSCFSGTFWPKCTWSSVCCVDLFPKRSQRKSSKINIINMCSLVCSGGASECCGCGCKQVVCWVCGTKVMFFLDLPIYLNFTSFTVQCSKQQ